MRVTDKQAMNADLDDAYLMNTEPDLEDADLMNTEPEHVDTEPGHVESGQNRYV